MSRQHSHPQRSPHTSPSGKLGSGVLSRPRTPDTLASLADWDDLAPTQPSLPRVTVARQTPSQATPSASVRPISPRTLALAADFGEFMTRIDCTHAPDLAPVALERRMRVFTVLSKVYESVLEATGRMEPSGRMEFS